MESIGLKFEEARKQKGLFIEQIAKDTNISKSFIEAIEKEQFDEFPAETYLLGFLRSYAAYLDLDPNEVVAIYRNTKIQEQPVPTELITKKKTIPLAAIVIIILVAAAGCGAFFYFNLGGFFNSDNVVKEKPVVTSPAVTKPQKPIAGNSYEMDSAFIERKFFINDAVVIQQKEKPYTIIVKQADAEKVVIELPSGDVPLAKGREIIADLDNDSVNDIRISVRDIDAAAGSAVLKFDRNTEGPSVISSSITSADELSDVSAVATETLSAFTPAASGNTNIQSRRQPETIISESETRQPFVINMSFKGYCLMRYEADGKPREEKYFNRGEVFRLDVSNTIKVWLSDASAVSATVNNAEYSFGKTGAVSAKIIGWNRKAEGGYAIKALPVY